MKKSITKIVATASAVIASVFVIVLLIAVFGGISEEDFNNSLVKGLFVTLACIFFLLTAVTLILLFINDDLVKEISLSSGKEGGTTISVSDVKKRAQKAILSVGGIKCKKCAVVDNEYGVRLKITVKIKGRNISDVDKYIRIPLEEEFAEAYNGFRFHSIEIRVKKLVTTYKGESTAVVQKAEPEDNKADIPAEDEAEEVAVSVEEE